ncbi:MAG: MotA/TolQ/ExbB proton channel family protein [Bacteroidales bacterium]|jgi:Biopolymer transport proteins|nr:MotA/TolQ/ExbB proton channel family protein [Bacteroidales bacterium]MBQ6301154.1 MotA/TolQ/ExbB proton channel family protein [Bacteroidales bacterium]MBR5397676.1 MotA/TolQ/ExbB proton channel family protein [Bacteroidales bacterium]
MKKFFMFLAVAGALTFTASIASAQDQPAAEGEATEQVQEAAPAEEAPAQLTAEDLLKGTGEDVPFHQQLKSYFIQGGPGFMSMILLCLIIGLALAIERILYLSFAKTNTKKLVKKVEDALAEGGVEKAKEVCRNTKGPVASIFYDGLLHYDEGLDVVEKRIASSGGVQMSLMENNLSWISLFIAIAPSLGFLGTVIGMVKAFDAIEAAGDISPNIVAGGMKVALITTVGGLIVAMILQVFYNYILSRIDALSIDMEEASIDLVDTLAKYEKKNK